MILILLLSLFFGFDSNAATLPDDSITVTTIDDIENNQVDYFMDSTTESVMESATESDEFDVLKDYGLHNLISFSYIRELPDKVSQADMYILFCRIYNLTLLFVWTFIAFNVIDLISRSVGRLKRKN